MSERYEHLMGVRPHRGAIRLLFPEGGFEALPDSVRHRGPWTGIFTGEMVRLKPAYRLAIARDGYCIVEGEVLGFKAEA